MLLGLLASGLAFLVGPVSFQAPATQSLHWLDLEGDGVLDALTVDGAGRVALFQNQGDGTFVDRTAAFGLEGQVVAQAARSAAAVPVLVGDVDRDRDEDLIVARSEGPALFLRVGATFVDSTPSSGLERIGTASSLAWVELDGAPGLDLHVVTAAGHRVFGSEPGGTFRELVLPFGSASGGVLPPSLEDPGVRSDREQPDPAPESGGPLSGGAGGGAGGSESSAGPVIEGSQAPPHPDIFDCVNSLSDISGGACVGASRVPLFGALFPLGVELFVDASTGHVGIGTTTPAHRLDVAGDLRVADTIVSTKTTGAPFQVASSDLVGGLNADLIDGLEASAFSQLGGSIETAELEDGSVSTPKLEDGAVTGPKLAAGAVTSSALASDSVGPVQLQAAAVTEPDLADDSVSASKIQLGAVTSAALAADAVTEEKLAASSVTAVAIAPGSVGTSALVLGAVDGSRLAPGAVGTTHIVPDAVTASELAAGAVGASELQAGAVGAVAVADGAIVSSKLAPGAVLTANLAPAAVTATELAPSAVGTLALQPGAVDTVALADDAVASAKIQDQAVTLAKLDPSSGAPGMLLGHDGSAVAWKPDDGVPAGTMLLLDTPTPPGGYSDTGRSIVVEEGLSTGTILAPLPTPRAEHGAAALAGLLYVAGGLNAGGAAIGSVDAYDPLLDAWTARAPLLVPRRGLALVELGGRLYAVGGSDAAGNALATVEEYDPLSNSWSARASLGLARRNLGCAAAGGKLYAVGGTDGSTEYAGVEEYDPSTDSWAPRALMPTARGHLGLAEEGGLIYALGGFTSANQATRLVEEYNPQTNTWRTVLPMAGDRWRLSATAVDGRVYALGGLDELGNVQPDVMRLAPPSIWVLALPLGLPRFSHATAVLDGKIHTTGGLLSTGATIANHEVLDPGTAQLYVMRKD